METAFETIAMIWGIAGAVSLIVPLAIVIIGTIKKLL